MRLYEFTNAEEQLGLLRIIIDNTWTAIAQQAKLQKDAEVRRKEQTKAPPRKAKGGRRADKRIPTPYQPLPKKSAPPQVQKANPKLSPIQPSVAPHKTLPTPNASVIQPPQSPNLATTSKDGYLE